ncbi:uncharacterized protein TNCV_871441 [Trichonephila clavipes]|nr:uncharacterized protein TNCV_871441 [Trichonephila clavipes]
MSEQSAVVWFLIAGATRGLLATDHVNHGQVTWTTSELAPPLLTTTPHQREDVSALDRFNVHCCPTRRVFSGTGLELVTRQATIRYLYHSATAAQKSVGTPTVLSGFVPLKPTTLFSTYRSIRFLSNDEVKEAIPDFLESQLFQQQNLSTAKAKTYYRNDGILVSTPMTIYFDFQ